MKTHSINKIITAGIFFLLSFVFVTTVTAKPPAWAPAHGYKAKTRYIYFPQQNIYYDLKTDRYIYPNNNTWIFGSALPSVFGPGNLGAARQVELDYYYSKPYIYNKKHVVIYDSPAKVKVVKVNPGNGNNYYPKEYKEKENEKDGDKGKDKWKENGKGNGNGKGPKK